MKTDMRKIDVYVKGIWAWTKEELEGHNKFFKWLADQVEDYLRLIKVQKVVKINFTLLQSSRSDNEIVFEAHDEELYPEAKLPALFENEGIRKLIRDNVVLQLKLGEGEKVCFRNGPISAYEKGERVTKEEAAANNPLLMEAAPENMGTATQTTEKIES